MGDTEGLMATENLMEEEGKGRHLLHLKHQCFRQFQSFGRDTGRRKKGRGSMCWIGVEPQGLRGFRYFYEIEEDWEVEGKEEVLIIKIVPGSRHFSFRIC